MTIDLRLSGLLALLIGVGWLAATNVHSRESTNGFSFEGALVDVAKIHHGGPQRDGIPAIDHPHFIEANQALFLKPDDRVLGISTEKAGERISRAYPIRILNWHELVNDHMGGENLLVSFCPLCGTGIIFETGDHAGGFGVSGLLYNSDMLLYDRATESLWSQIPGKAITGPSAGATLKLLPSEQTSWADWRQRHPNTRVMTRRTGFIRDYNTDPYRGYGASKAIYFPLDARSNRYHPKEHVIGLVINGKARVWPFVELSRNQQDAANGILKETFENTELEIRYDAQHRHASIYDENGKALATTTGFWFAWYAFHPKTSIYKAP